MNTWKNIFNLERISVCLFLCFLLLGTCSKVMETGMFKFGGSNPILEDKIKSVQATDDGGFIACGVWQRTDGFVLKFHSNFTVQWSIILTSFVLEDIKITNDSKYISTGHHRFFDSGYFYNLIILKISNDGGLVWGHKITTNKVEDQLGKAVAVTKNGDYLVAASAELISDSGWCGILLIKISFDGAIIWLSRSSKFFYWNPCLSSMPVSIENTNNGSILVTSRKGSNVFIAKYQEDGNFTFAKFFGGDQTDRGLVIKSTQDGGYVVFGQAKSSKAMFFSKFHHNDSMDWTVLFEDSLKKHYLYDGLVTSTGSFLATGFGCFDDSFCQGSGDNNIYISSVDSNGELQWTTYASEVIAVGISIEELKGGGYVVAGSQGINTNYDNFFSVVDENGEGCIWKSFDLEGFDLDKDYELSFYTLNDYTSSYTVDLNTNISDTIYILEGGFSVSVLNINMYKYCSGYACFGNYSKDACFDNHGNCEKLDENTTHCVCEHGYYGTHCGEGVCFEILSNQSNVCSGRGKCVDKDECVDCENVYFGEECEKKYPASFFHMINTSSGWGENIIGLEKIYNNDNRGFLAALPNKNFGPSPKNMLLLKFRFNGSLESGCAFGPGSNDPTVYSIKSTKDGGVIVVGERFTDYTGHYGPMVVKFRSNLTVEWSCAVGTTSSSLRTYGYSIAEYESGGGGYVLTGMTTKEYSSVMPIKFIPAVSMFKFSKSGGMDWVTTFGDNKNGGFYYETRTRGLCVIESEDGGFVVVGRKQLLASESVGFILKLDFSGQFVWGYTLGNDGAKKGAFTSVLLCKDKSGYVVTGKTTHGPSHEYNIYLVKFFLNGHIDFMKSLGYKDSHSVSMWGRSILERDEGGFTVFGVYEHVSVITRDIIVEFSEDGEYQNGVLIDVNNGDDIRDDDYYDQKAIEVKDKGYIIMGYEEDDQKVYVYKTYDQGEGCYSEPNSLNGLSSNIILEDIEGIILNIWTPTHIDQNVTTPALGHAFITNYQEVVFGSSELSSLLGFERGCVLENYCFGYIDSRVCNSRGNCTDYNQCSCHDQNMYFGEQCEVHYCFDILSNDSSNVCSSHGSCVGVDECQCLNNYTSTQCGMFKCNGFWRNDSKVCKGGSSGEIKRGNCTKHDYCECEPNYQESLNCDWSCFGIPNWEINSCGVYGDCIDHNTCNCTLPYNYTLGTQICDVPVCRNIAKGTEGVCSGHGDCVNPNECECDLGYQSTVDGYCDWFGCFGITFSDTSKVCNGHGTCGGYNECKCKGEYEGSSCSTWKCGGYDKDSLKCCSGNGDCISPGTCKCTKTGFAGEQCQKNTLYLSVMLPVLSTSGISALGIFLLVLFACCCCCIFICCCSILVICCLGVYIISKAFKYKKFDKLKNLDILLQEQYAEENTAIAQIKINKKLFEIPIKELKIIRILGEGGSSSIVYLAKWQGQKVAFKCFKTRMICSSQDSFDEFDQEVQVFANLGHPNIVSFFGATLDPPRVGIVMEFCPKGECYEYVVEYEEKTGKKYPMKERIRMLSEISSAMEYLHCRAIVHRDLKTENVLLNDAEQCKLMDFGVARISERLSKQVTKGIGTSFYMAPEITISDGMYNEKCDVFSFAILLWIMISGNNMPYGSDTTMGIELKVANDPNFRPKIEYMEEVLTEEQNWVIDLAKQCWNHESNERPSFEEICKRIDEKLSDFKEKEMITTTTIIQEEKNRSSIEKNELTRTSVETLLVKNKNLKEDLDEKERIIERMSKEIEFLKKK